MLFIQIDRISRPLPIERCYSTTLASLPSVVSTTCMANKGRLACRLSPMTMRTNRLLAKTIHPLPILLERSRPSLLQPLSPVYHRLRPPLPLRTKSLEPVLEVEILRFKQEAEDWSLESLEEEKQSRCPRESRRRTHSIAFERFAMSDS